MRTNSIVTESTCYESSGEHNRLAFYSTSHQGTTMLWHKRPAKSATV